MADSSLLVRYLDRVETIGSLAGKLGVAFQQEKERQRRTRCIDPASWERHKPAFDEYCQSLFDLRRDFPTPPEGAETVPECILRAVKTVREVCDGMKKSSYRDFAEFLSSFPSLNSTAQDLYFAIRDVRKRLESVDPFAAFDTPMTGNTPATDSPSAGDRRQPDSADAQAVALPDAHDFRDLYAIVIKVCEHLGAMTGEWWYRHHPGSGSGNTMGPTGELNYIVVDGESEAAWCRRLAAKEYRDQLRSQLLRLWRPGLPTAPKQDADAESDIRNVLTPWLMEVLSRAAASAAPNQATGNAASTPEIPTTKGKFMDDPYSLGNLLNDLRNYEATVSLWEKASDQCRNPVPAHLKGLPPEQVDYQGFYNYHALRAGEFFGQQNRIWSDIESRATKPTLDQLKTICRAREKPFNLDSLETLCAQAAERGGKNLEEFAQVDVATGANLLAATPASKPPIAMPSQCERKDRTVSDGHVAGLHSNDCKTRRVFISYSHDSPEHCQRVLELANVLRSHGVDAELDSYYVRPPEGWPRWCEKQLRPENSDFVLMICTQTYRCRVEDKVHANEGRGVFWEGGIIYEYIYDAKGNTRFIPVLLVDASTDCIPITIRNHTRYQIERFDLSDAEYEGLYRELTGQPAISKPDLGKVISLGQHPAVATPLAPRPVETTFPTPNESHESL